MQVAVATHIMFMILPTGNSQIYVRQIGSDSKCDAYSRGCNHRDMVSVVPPLFSELPENTKTKLLKKN